MRRSLGNRNDPEGSDSEDLAQDFRPSDIDMIDGMLSNFGISSEATKEDLRLFFIFLHQKFFFVFEIFKLYALCFSFK